MIEKLRNAMEVQDETMEKQDQILQQREEELKQTQNGNIFCVMIRGLFENLEWNCVSDHILEHRIITFTLLWQICNNKKLLEYIVSSENMWLQVILLCRFRGTVG